MISTLNKWLYILINFDNNIYFSFSEYESGYPGDCKINSASEIALMKFFFEVVAALFILLQIGSGLKVWTLLNEKPKIHKDKKFLFKKSFYIDILHDDIVILNEKSWCLRFFRPSIKCVKKSTFYTLLLQNLIFYLVTFSSITIGWMLTYPDH